MMQWPDHRLLDLLCIELPIIQAPMAGVAFSELSIAVAAAGGLGSLACALLNAEQIRDQVHAIRTASIDVPTSNHSSAGASVIPRSTTRPLNLNFFCHRSPRPDAERAALWQKGLEKYYREFGLIESSSSDPQRKPFDSSLCNLVEDLKPEVVSFHFGLPAPELLQRVRASGAKILSSATTVDEARWLAARGCDAIIAMGSEAGGHRAMFLTDDIATQIGTLALVPQIVDAVDVPVIAAGGIGDARGIAAAFALGAAGVQLGTVYLSTPEVKISAPYRAALRVSCGDQTVLTNLFSGRPARGIVNRLIRELGAISSAVPDFPLAGAPLAALRAHAESLGSGDFTPLWAGQAVGLNKEMPALELTRQLAAETLAIIFAHN